MNALGPVGQLLNRMVRDSLLGPKLDAQEDRHAKLFVNYDDEDSTS